tara:strand:+ start:2034 stop:3119 length:1086 start_codon:yes stop_codon:yes gene_type:complete
VPKISDKPLFTPGPLTTSPTVKQAMLRDLGSRDSEFINIVAGIRQSLLKLADLTTANSWEAVPMQGSGTFAIESALTTLTPPDGKWLVIINGAYGERILKIADRNDISAVPLRCAENQQPCLDAVDTALRQGGFTHVATIHCETTSGILNPVNAIGAIARQHGCMHLVDSMSAFGGVEFEFTHIDCLVSSANKCIQGVPGFAFTLCHRPLLEHSHARTLSLDLADQWHGLEANGQFRFTPPTHTLLAFDQALRELDAEGGVAARATRYQANHKTCLEGMRALGFREYVPEPLQGHIITSFLYPSENFDFEDFYDRLNEKGFVIYPGKVTQADCFRIGHIGHLFPKDTEALLSAVREIIAGE